MTEPISAKITNMIGMTLTFTKKVSSGVDALNNSTFTTSNITIDDCLVAPMTEPLSAREQQAMDQSKDQVRIHIPKLSTDDVSNSDVTYDGKIFHLDSDSVVLMIDNTPGRWNRYFRAEHVNA